VISEPKVAPNRSIRLYYILHYFPAKRQSVSADKLHVKAANILPLVGLARSKQDPVNNGHGSQFHTGPRQPGLRIV
jgi:hypothetical protein